MINRNDSPLFASASRSRTTLPGLWRSREMPPLARNRGPSGVRMISALISTRGGTPPLHINSSMATQSQLDVCGAPTRMPELGTSPTVCQRVSRNNNRANALRTVRPLLVIPREAKRRSRVGSLLGRVGARGEDDAISLVCLHRPAILSPTRSAESVLETYTFLRE